MISVILTSVIVFGIAITITGRNFSDYNQVREDRQFEHAIQVADSGVDATLFKLGPDPGWDTGETLPGGESFLETRTLAEQEAWVLANVSGNPVVQVQGGEYAIVKPANVDVVFSVGYIPSYVDPQKRRIIRARYDVAPFVPDTAIFTGGDLDMQGNAILDGEAGSAHANGDVRIQGNPSFTGYVSASEDYEVIGAPTIGDEENSGGGKPPREIPTVNPRDTYELSEYDLCPDGLVRAGPLNPDAPNDSFTPCTGDELGSGNGNTSYRGWVFTNGVWGYNNTGTNYDGSYYAYHTSVSVTGGPGTTIDPWDVTIMAEADATGPEPGHCPHTGGDISVGGNPHMRSYSRAAPLLLIAGRDLDVTGNSAGGEVNYNGVLAAHEGFKVHGNMTLVGLILANDFCDTLGSPVQIPEVDVTGSVHITYNGGMEVPIGRILRTTHWNEL